MLRVDRRAASLQIRTGDKNNMPGLRETDGMSEEIILETEELTKEFAGFVAVSGVNLRVGRGTIHALIGPNGAGKTTCFNLLTKFLKPTSGRIVYNGADITGWRRPTWRGGAWCVVPDLGGVPASERARKRPHRPAEEARRIVRLLALEPRARRASTAARSR